MIIKTIQYDECLTLWNLLWADRVSAIESTSAMTLPVGGAHRSYSSNIGIPVFLGAYQGDLLIGVNSFHSVDTIFRSRGLYVLDEFRGNKIGQLLLEKTIELAGGRVWSFPKQEAINTYIRAGFHPVGQFEYDHIEKKRNCYVTT
jgi:GNAT superfamily N-acetyltransferase